MKKLNIEEVKLQAKKFCKWIVLDNHYEGAYAKLNCQCAKCGHVHKLSWRQIRSGGGCVECNRRLKLLPIEYIKKEAFKKGWLVSSNNYDGRLTKLNCQCIKCGYKTQFVWQSIRKNVKCEKCNKISKLEFIRAEFVKEGYKLLTEIYENNAQKLEYICPNGHQRFIAWANWQQNQRCPCFSNRLKPTIEFIRSEFAKRGYKLLTKVYKNCYQKLNYICPRGCRHSINWNNWQRGQGCPCFSNKMKPTIEYIRAEFAKEGYELLTEVYENNTQKLEYICSMGCKHSVTWMTWNFKDKHRCPCFLNNVKLTIEFIRAEFAKEGYILLTKVYENVQQKLEYICPRGHRYFICWNSWNSKRKCRCPYCNNNGVSKWEKAVKKFLRESTIDHIPNDKTQLVNPNTNYKLELDIWMPKSNKAIECNGIYWHKNRQHIDLLKKQLCKDQNIDLLVITDEEWNKDIGRCKRKLISFVKSEIKICRITE